MSDPGERYAFIEDGMAFDAYCLTIVQGQEVDAVLRAFSVIVATETLLTFGHQPRMSAPYPLGEGNDTVFVDTFGGAVVAAEFNGWAGTEEQRARTLSAIGSHTALYRSVNADMRFVHARRGAVVRTFDPLLYVAEGALAEEEGLPFGWPGRPAAAALMLVERLTGVRLERSWLLDVAHPTYRRDPGGGCGPPFPGRHSSETSG
jgi:hypothetical protein